MTMIRHLNATPTPIARAFADWHALQEALVADRIPEAVWLATVNAAGLRIREIEELRAQTVNDVWMKVVVAMGDSSDLEGELPWLAETAISELGLEAGRLWGKSLAA